MKSGAVLPRSLVVLGMVGAMLSVVPSIGAAKDKAPPPDLSGTWKLNEEKSESLQEKMESSGGGPPGMGGPPPGMGGMGGPPMGGMGGGPPMGGGGRRGRPNGGDPMKDPVMAALARPPLMLMVEQSESEVLLSERGRTLRTLSLLKDDPNPEVGGIERMKAKWEGARLIAQGQSGEGRKLQESYRLSKDGKSLTVTVKGDGPGGDSIELERVYDRYEGESESMQ